MHLCDTGVDTGEFPISERKVALKLSCACRFQENGSTFNGAPVRVGRKGGRGDERSHIWVASCITARGEIKFEAIKQSRDDRTGCGLRSDAATARRTAREWHPQLILSLRKHTHRFKIIMKLTRDFQVNLKWILLKLPLPRYYIRSALSFSAVEYVARAADMPPTRASF